MDTAFLMQWLHQQALRGADPCAVLEGICARFGEEGIDVERSVIGYLVFHPQFDGMNFTWTRATGKAERASATRPNMFGAPSPFLHMQSTGVEEMRFRLEQAQKPLPFPFLEHIRHLGFTDYFAFFQPFGTRIDPSLWPDLPGGRDMKEGVTGSFGTTKAGGFQQAELAFFRALATPIAVTFKTAALFEMAETLLCTYLGSASGQNVLRGRVRRGQGQVIHAVIWHSDMRGSTALAGSSSLEDYLASLNAYYDCVVGPIAAEGGEVLKFIGDGVLAMFPFEAGTRSGKTAAASAISAARAAMKRLAELNARRAETGAAQIQCGIGLHAGDVMHGNVGSEGRLDFTVTGAAVNEVCRLESLCKEMATPVIVSAPVAALYDEGLQPLGSRILAGIDHPIEVFGLV